MSFVPSSIFFLSSFQTASTFYNADLSFPHEMLPEEQLPKFHTDGVSLYPGLGSAFDWLKKIFKQSEALPRSR